MSLPCVRKKGGTVVYRSEAVRDIEDYYTI